MTQRPILGIVACGASPHRPLVVARAQAFAASAPAAGWDLLAIDVPGDHGTDLEGAHAVILIDPTPEDVAMHLAHGRAVLLDGANSLTPFEAQNLADRAATHRQPLMIGDELLHADALAAALSAATEIGPLTRIESRILHPTGRPAPTRLAEWNERALPGLFRLLLALRRLCPDGASPIWERVHRSQRSGLLQISIHGRVPGTPDTRITVIVGEQAGRSVIQDIQIVSATAVVRSELMPDVHLEVNGTTRTLASPTHSPAQLEVFGMIPMLDLLRRAVIQRTQPLTGPAVLAEALRVSDWAWAQGDDPSR